MTGEVPSGSGACISGYDSAGNPPSLMPAIPAPPTASRGLVAAADPQKADADAVANQDGQDVADGGFRRRQVRPNLVAVTAAVLVFDDIPGRGQVSDDRRCAR